MVEKLSGIIDRITFHNSENGFAVLRVQVAGRREPVTVVGVLASPIAGEYVEAAGLWVEDPEHGTQFKAESLRTTPPHSIEGIEKYLGSGLIKGIGPHYARKIVEVFGERTFAVLDESPAFLQEIKGIGPHRMALIRASWQQQKTVRTIMIFLQSQGVGTARAVRIYKQYGDKAIDLIRENPYRLAADIWGIGFQSADQIAERLGIDRGSPVRARAAIRYILQELSGQGHCGFPEAGVMEETRQLTGIRADVIARAVEESIAGGELVRETIERMPWLYLKTLFLAESSVARALVELCQGTHPLPPIQSEKALAWVEKKIGLQLAATQRDAILRATTSKVLIITGGPGVGKTTLVRGILEIFTAKKMRCGLCAPTGRAAKRLAETTGQEAKTIHRLLEFNVAAGRFERDRGQSLELDLLVVDEASMVDIALMGQLLRAMPPAACLILVGDVDQLPSVGPGTVLADIIASGTVPVVRLTEIFRQAGQSRIVRAAHQVNHGELPESAPNAEGDFFFIEAATPPVILDRILALLCDRIPARFGFNSLRDIQVLTPMNRSELGTRNLNARLQEALNPPKPGPEIHRFGWTFRVGDKVIQLINNYQKDIFNGDIGQVTGIDEVDQEVTANFDGRSVVYDFGELDELALAYALSIHKSQGSEYPAVVIPLHMQHYRMLQRHLLYTAITRGKKLVVLVGNRKALALAVGRQDTSRRFSALARRLRDSLYVDPVSHALASPPC